MSAIPRPRPPRERLSSLKDAGKTRPVGALPPRNKPKRRTCCDDPSPEELDGAMVCASCGNLISESQIVAEVTFGETSAGAAVVQGGFVGDDQRHANTMGSGARRLGLGGGGGRTTAETNGRDAIRGLATAMRITLDGAEGAAMSIYKLAATMNFIHGRRPIVLAACCLYYVCRTKKGNKFLLIDFAEKIKLNVFKLGETYKELLSKLFMDEPAMKNSYAMIEPEPLIKKYVDKLEFGDVGGRKVADDAVKILRRMRRDWMVDGRQPAGICGACIILAARMNNFRRTVREVVYVVKVADMTIAKRLIEFKRTQSGRLTVDQFRRLGENLPGEKEPPAIYQAREREAKRRRLTQSEEEAENVQSDTGSQRASVALIPSSEPRRDADGFVVPGVPRLPIDPNLLAATNLAAEELQVSERAAPKKKAGRPKKKKKESFPPLADEDLIVEQEIEEEIERILHDPETVNNMEESKFALVEARSKALANQMKGEQRAPETAEIGEHEFDDDPEVANCLLSPAEIVIKERIWVTHNHDWMREQQAKLLKKALEEANGGPKKKTRKRNQTRVGDVSEYTRESPMESPADAAQRMLQKRGKGFSKSINYERLNAVMGKGRETSTSQGSSVRPSNASSPAPSEMSMEVEEEPLDASAGASRGISHPTPPATQSQRILQPHADGDGEEDEEDEGGEDDHDVDAVAEDVGLNGLNVEGEFDDDGFENDWA